MKIHIKGGTLIDPVAGTEQQADVFVADGKIAALGTAAPAGFNADNTIDAAGMIVAPGLVDCVRGCAAGYEHKATLASEMAAAVAGGVTTLVCPPDTDPCSTSRASSRCSSSARATCTRRTCIRSAR